MKALKTFLFLICLYVGYYFFVTTVVIRNRDFRGAIHHSVDKLINDIQTGSVKIAILGDSAIQSGLIPSVFSSAAFNFSNYSADPRLNFFRYNQIIKKNGPSIRCLIVGSFFTHELRYVDELFFSVHMYHDFYTLDEAKEIYDSSQNLNIYPARDLSKIEYYFKVLAAKLKFFGPDFLQLQRALRFWSDSKSFVGYRQSVVENKGFAPLSPVDQQRHNDFDFFGTTKYFAKKFEPEKTFDVYLEKLINQAAANGSKVFFVILPIYLEKNNHMEVKYLNDLEEFMKNKQKKLDNFKLIRLGSLNDKKYFFNLNHLSYEGGRLVSEELKSRLAGECNEEKPL